jgi:hypothetical protein
MLYRIFGITASLKDTGRYVSGIFGVATGLNAARWFVCSIFSIAARLEGARGSVGAAYFQGNWQGAQ